MKLIAVTLVAVIALVSAADEFVSKKEATNLLDNQENSRFRRAAMGKSLKKLQKKWNNICKFNSVEKWSEFKDELEETNLPEKEVDSLERCTEGFSSLIIRVAKGRLRGFEKYFNRLFLHHSLYFSMFKAR